MVQLIKDNLETVCLMEQEYLSMIFLIFKVNLLTVGLKEKEQ
jgi:hypothetical protein